MNPAIFQKKEVPNPVRQSIEGITDRIGPLRELVQTLPIDDPLKAFLDAELSDLKANAATIHLHDIERPGGGFDLHVSMQPVHLGLKPQI